MEKISITKELVMKTILEKYPELTENNLFHGKRLTQLAVNLLKVHIKKVDSTRYYSRYESLFDEGLVDNLGALCVYCDEMSNPVLAKDFEKYLQENDKCLLYFPIKDGTTINPYNCEATIGLSPEVKECIKERSYHKFNHIDCNPNNVVRFYIYGEMMTNLRGIGMSDEQIAELLEKKLMK